MQRKYILHMLTTARNLSPFDVNMAVDAGWEVIVPYTLIENADVQPLVQDAVFSRGLNGIKHTAMFVGGRDVVTSIQIIQAAKKAMLPPFEISLMADPSGAYTTACAMVAMVELKLKQDYEVSWKDCTVMVLGGSGPVGLTAASLVAENGAKVLMMSRSKGKAHAAVDVVKSFCPRTSDYCIVGYSNDNKYQLLEKCHVVFAAAAPGVQILDAEELALATQLKVVADVNAVPSLGVCGLDLQHNGQAIDGTRSGVSGFGAFAIGKVKYLTQQHLLRRMKQTPSPLCLQHREAYEEALVHASENQ